MKNNLLILLLTTIVFVSCKTDIVDVVNDKGYFEYQYSYKIVEKGVEITKFANKRVNLKSATFAFHKTTNLPDSVKDLGIRKVEVTIHSETSNIDSLNRPLGYSYIKLMLTDTLALNVNPNRLLSYIYYTTIPSYALTIGKKPFCIGLDMYINQTLDAESKPVFDYHFVGEAQKKVTLYNFGNGRCQIIANGVSNSIPYNLNYVGKVSQENDIE